jgi:hypothetical protein
MPRAPIASEVSAGITLRRRPKPAPKPTPKYKLGRAAAGGAVLARGTFQPSNRRQQAQLHADVVAEANRLEAEHQKQQLKSAYLRTQAQREQARQRGQAARIAALDKKLTAMEPHIEAAGFFSGPPKSFAVKLLGRTAGDLVSTAYHTPGGIYALGKATTEDTAATRKGDFSFKRSRAIGAEMGKQTAQSFEHPLRHPGYTLLNLGAAASLGAGAAAKLGAAGEAARAGELGEAAKALVKRPPVRPRIIEQGGLPVSLPASRNQAFRAAQAAHDAVLRRVLAKNPEGHVASYAAKRLGGSLEETRRYRASMQSAPARAIEAGGRTLNKVEQAALRLASEQSTPEEAIAFHERQLAQGIEPKAQKAQIKLLSAVRDRGLISLDESRPAGERVHINAEVHPGLAAIDKQLASAGAERDVILARTGQMPAEGLQERIDKPGQIRSGKEIVMSPAGTAFAREAGTASIHELERNLAQSRTILRGELRKLRTLQGRATRPRVSKKVIEQAGVRTGEGGQLSFTSPATETRVAKVRGRPTVQKAIEKQRATVQEWQRQVAADTKRLNEEGPKLVANPVRPGRNYVPYYETEKGAARGAAASAAGPIVGKAQGIVPKSKTFSGAALERGKVPPNTTGLVARQLQRAYRYANTDEFRRTIAKAGAKTRQTSRDVLVSTQELKNAKVPDELRAELGGGALTLDELSGHAQAFDAWRQHLLPGVADKFRAERGVAIGTEAPKGFTWVDKNLLGKLGHQPVLGPPGRIARTADTVNSAATAATVYYKLGHIATRAGTNFVANVIQGSAHPLQLARSARLWKSLSPVEKLRALGAAGEGGIHALPHEGQNLVGSIASGGAKWWSKHVDAPFRFNSLAYEARQAGIRTPTAFRKLLDDMQDPSQLSPAEAAKVDRIAKRANREAIAYDRLNEFEKRYLRRAVWFYPWISGSTRFAANTLLEHPLKSAAIGNLGQVGARRQEAQLGSLPSYAQGLFKVGGSKKLPRVMDVGTISPFGTPAEVTRAALHFNRPSEADQLSRFLNPALSAGARAVFHLDAYGRPSTGTTLHNVLTGLGATTPEAALLKGLKSAKQDQSKRMYQANRRDVFKRLLFGSEMPRTLNRQVANVNARKEELATLAPPERFRTQMGTLRKTLVDDGRRYGLLQPGENLPPQLDAALKLHAQRYGAYKRANASSQLDRFKVDLRLLATMGKVTAEDRQAAVKWAATASSDQIESERRKISQSYFNTAWLSYAIKQLSEHGVSVTVPR